MQSYSLMYVGLCRSWLWAGSKLHDSSSALNSVTAPAPRCTSIHLADLFLNSPVDSRGRLWLQSMLHPNHQNFNSLKTACNLRAIISLPAKQGYEQYKAPQISPSSITRGAGCLVYKISHIMPHAAAQSVRASEDFCQSCVQQVQGARTAATQQP